MTTSKNEDVEQAYQELCEQSSHEYGANPYNGTISTTDGYRVVTRTLMSSEAAARHAEQRCENMAKHTCEAVPVGKPARTKHRKATFTVPAGTDTQRRTVTVEHVAAALGVSTETIVKWQVVTSTPKYKVTTRKPGPARTAWTTSRGGSYPTRAAATAAARKHLTAMTERQMAGAVFEHAEIIVRKETVNTPEAAVSATLTSWKVTVDVELTAGELTFSHWLFYGVASY